MVELSGLLRRLLHQPTDTGLNSLQFSLRNTNRIQLPADRGFYRFRHEKSGLLEGVKDRDPKACCTDLPTDSWGAATRNEVRRNADGCQTARTTSS